MQDNIFNDISAKWSKIRASGAPNLKALVSGLVDPSRIMVQRVGESPTTLTLMFKGFDQALENPDKDAPLLNRAIFAWIKKFGEAQIIRGGDNTTFTIMLRKAQPAAPPTVMPQQPMESVNRGPLVRISNVRKIDG